jgi:HNH endonuclease
MTESKLIPETYPDCSFKFFPREYLSDMNIRMMSLAERGKHMTKLLHAVVNRDETFVNKCRNYVGRVHWPKLYKCRRHVSLDIRRAVFVRDGGRCVQCGSGDRPELDHILAYSRGGPDTFDNLQILCKPCNVRKGAK